MIMHCFCWIEWDSKRLIASRKILLCMSVRKITLFLSAAEQLRAMATYAAECCESLRFAARKIQWTEISCTLFPFPRAILYIELRMWTITREECLDVSFVMRQRKSFRQKTEKQTKKYRTKRKWFMTFQMKQNIHIRMPFIWCTRESTTQTYICLAWGYFQWAATHWKTKKKEKTNEF